MGFCGAGIGVFVVAALGFLSAGIGVFVVVALGGLWVAGSGFAELNAPAPLFFSGRKLEVAAQKNGKALMRRRDGQAKGEFIRESENADGIPR